MDWVRIGLVGKPNVGKSTFFSAATLAKVDIANYPFCTIEPNVGVAFVAARLDCPCKDIRVKLEAEGRIEAVTGRRSKKRAVYVSQERVPVLVIADLSLASLLDIAGLVPGASEGRGTGKRLPWRTSPTATR